MIHSSKQNGFALISALVVLSLVTGVTVAMAVNQRSSVELTTDIVRFNQVNHHSDGILLWGQGVLLEDLEENNTDSAIDKWNQALIDVEIAGGEIDAVITDLQSRFNINNLALQGDSGELAQDRFRRLLSIVGVTNDFTDAVADWVDEDTETRFPNGAEDDYYLSLEQPYRSANQPLVDVSELLLIKGVDLEDYEKLLPYVFALSPIVGININTASDQVLLSLAEDINSAVVEEIKSVRETTPFSKISNQAEESTDGDNTANNINSPEDNGGLSDQIDRCTELGGGNESAIEQCIDELFGESEELVDIDNNIIANTTESTQDEEVVLSELSIISETDLDLDGLTVDSNYFEVTGQVQLLGRELLVSYLLQRDSSTGDIQVISRSNNGVAYE